MNDNNALTLRPVEAGDLAALYEMQCDPESNRMAVVIPRTKEKFDAHWAKALHDPAVTARVILLDRQVVGLVARFVRNGESHVGYWIDRAYWGRGFASRALQLFLDECTVRPLHASAAVSNRASLRVMAKCGFVVVETRIGPADERRPECEEAVLILR